MTGNTMNSIGSLGTSYSFGSGFSVSGGTKVSLALTGSDGIVTNGGTIGLSGGPLGTVAFMSSGAFSSSGALFSVSTSGAAIGNGGFTGNGTSTNSLAFDPYYVAAAVPMMFGVPNWAFGAGGAISATIVTAASSQGNVSVGPGCLTVNKGFGIYNTAIGYN